MAAEQPIWKLTLPGELDGAALEELVGRAAIRQTGGAGLRLERADVAGGSTTIFLSGSRADAQTLLATVGESRARRPKLASCTVEELHRTPPAPRGKRAPTPRRRA